MERQRIKLTRWQHVTLSVLWLLMVILLLVFLTVSNFMKIISFNTTLTENITAVIADSIIQTQPITLGLLATDTVYNENVTVAVITTF